MRKVTIDRFQLMTTEVSHGIYTLCVDAGFCSATATGDTTDPSIPASRLTWLQATTVCQWLGGRLPTEAEWEYAIRGSDGRRYPWGNEPRCPHRTQAEENRLLQRRQQILQRCPPLSTTIMPRMTTTQLESIAAAADLWSFEEVDLKCEPLRDQTDPERILTEALDWIRETHARASLNHDLPECDLADLDLIGGEYGLRPHGLQWMAGNVAEWVADTYRDDFYESTPTTNPFAHGTADAPKVLRGGSALTLDPADWRTTARLPMAPHIAAKDTGTRCAWDVPKGSP